MARSSTRESRDLSSASSGAVCPGGPLLGPSMAARGSVIGSGCSRDVTLGRTRNMRDGTAGASSRRVDCATPPERAAPWATVVVVATCADE